MMMTMQYRLTLPAMLERAEQFFPKKEIVFYTPLALTYAYDREDDALDSLYTISVLFGPSPLGGGMGTRNGEILQKSGEIWSATVISFTRMRPQVQGLHRPPQAQYDVRFPPRNTFC